ARSSSTCIGLVYSLTSPGMAAEAIKYLESGSSAGPVAPVLRESFLGKIKMGFRDGEICRLLRDPVPRGLQMAHLLSLRQVCKPGRLRKRGVLHDPASPPSGPLR